MEVDSVRTTVGESYNCEMEVDSVRKAVDSVRKLIGECYNCEMEVDSVRKTVDSS